MTFGALYGRPGPAEEGYQRTLPSTTFPNRTQSVGNGSLIYSFTDPAPVSPFDSSTLPRTSFPAEHNHPASPFADPVPVSAAASATSASLAVQTPPRAAVNLLPSHVASSGNAETTSPSGYSPVVRSSYRAEEPVATPFGSPAPGPSKNETRPDTVYEDDPYAGI